MEPKVGDRGFFGRGNGEKTLGEIVKVNRTTLKVKQLEARGTFKAHAVGTVWKVAKSLWTPENSGRPAFGARATEPEPPRPRRSEDEILMELRSVESALSPENLHCDGEISMAAARRKASFLNARRRRLVAELGREPTCRDLYGDNF